MQELFETKNGRVIMDEDLSAKMYLIKGYHPEKTDEASSGFEWSEMGMASSRRLYEMKMPFINTKPIRLIELFGGIGAQAMALTRLGIDFEHYRLVEYDKYPVRSYNAIHGTNFEPTDITKISGSDLGIVDTDKYCYLMTYSFPCQDLSLAGKQKGMSKGTGTRSGLLWEVERLLNETENLPQLLLMENVTQVHGTKNIEDFTDWINFLENKGYSNFWQDLDARNYGIPQSRNRCFMVSILGDYCFYFPTPRKLDKVMKDYLEDSVDEKYYIDNDKAKVLIEKLIADTPIRDKDGIDLTINDPHRKNIANCVKARYDNGISNQKSDGTGVIEMIIKDNTNNHISQQATIIQRPRGFNKGGEFIDSPTITSHKWEQNNFIKQNLRIRKLTPKECYRLMGFDDAAFEKAEKVNSNTQLYKQAGNSIVVDVLMAIFDNLLIHSRSVWLDNLLETDEEVS